MGARNDKLIYFELYYSVSNINSLLEKELNCFFPLVDGDHFPHKLWLIPTKDIMQFIKFNNTLNMEYAP